MKYVVITAFMDMQDKNHGYSIGDEYPRDDRKPASERIIELSGKSNRRGIPLIEEMVNILEESKETKERNPKVSRKKGE